jgi:sodium-dependent dicarboxylate transporter 2/3/5
MLLKNKYFMLLIGVMLGAAVLLLPRPEGTKFEIFGDLGQALAGMVSADFQVVPGGNQKKGGYILETRNPGTATATGEHLEKVVERAKLVGVSVEYVDGLSPRP